MLSKTFTSGRIRRADYNPESLDDLFGPDT